MTNDDYREMHVQLVALRYRYKAAVKNAYEEGWSDGRDFERALDNPVTARYADNREASWLASDALRAAVD